MKETHRKMIKSRYGHVIERFLLNLPIDYKAIAIPQNCLSGVGVMLCFVAMVLIYKMHPISGAVFIVLAGLCDVLDGLIARANFRTSKYGTLINSCLTILSDLIIFIGLILFYSKSGRQGVYMTFFVCFSMLITVMLNYTRAQAEAFIDSCEVGILERPERIILLVVGLLFNMVKYALWLYVILAIVTIVQRMIYAYDQLHKQES